MNLADLAKQGKEVRINCPYCINRVGSYDKKGHMYINTETGAFFCHRCKANGYDLNLKIKKNDLVSVIKEEAEPLNERIAKLKFTPIYQHEYLNSRGLTDNQINYYKFGTIEGQEDFIFIPLIEDKIVGYQGRNTTDSKFRYLNLPTGVKLGQSLFQLNTAREYNTVIVVEGIFDAISIGLNAVCIFKNFISKIQKQKIVNSKFKRIIFGLDADSKRQSYKYAQEYKELGFETAFVNYPYSKKIDYNDIYKQLGRKGVEKLLKTYVTWV